VQGTSDSAYHPPRVHSRAMRTSIYLKLLLLSVSIALIPLMIAGVVVVGDTRDELKSSVNDELITTAQGVADELDRRYQGQWLAPLRLLANTVDDPQLGAEAKLALLTRISALPDLIALQLSLSDEMQPVLITQDRIAERMRAKGQEPLQLLGVPPRRLTLTPTEQGVSHGSVSYIKSLDLWLLNLVMRLETPVDGVRPLLLARIDLGRLAERIAALPFARNGDITLVTADGRPLFGDGERPLKQDALHDRALEGLLSGLRGAEVMPYQTQGGHEMLGGYALPQTLRWAVIVSRDAATAYLPVRRMLQKLLLWTGVAALLAVLGAWIFSRRLSHPIITIEGVARRVGGGDFLIQVPTLRRRDEIGRLGMEINRMIIGLRERERVKEIFGRFQSREVVERLLETPGALELGGERRRITIMMTDLRGFTAISERLRPEQVVQMLNHYFDPMVEICIRHQGTINEIIGDSLLVLFGAPIHSEGHAAHAVACAIEMQRAMAEVNRRIHAAGLPELEMGIGLHNGEVVLGNVGSEKRAKFAVIGSEVNLTSRIESYAVGGQVLISDSVRLALGESLEVAGTRWVQPKGVGGQIAIHEVVGLDGVRLPDQADPCHPLAHPLPVHYRILEGKHPDAAGGEGEIVALGHHNAELATKGLMEPLSDLKINLVDPEFCNQDIYAKIREMRDGRCLIRFTSLPEGATALFDRLR